MTAAPGFRSYVPADLAACLALFDANCPEFFAPRERGDYVAFLGAAVADYVVCTLEDRVVGAYGLAPHPRGGTAIRWILLDPAVQGAGIGRRIMTRVLEQLRSADGWPLRISTSQKSAAFFTRFGARTLSTTPDGWGPGLHRIEMEVAP